MSTAIVPCAGCGEDVNTMEGAPACENCGTDKLESLEAHHE